MQDSLSFKKKDYEAHNISVCSFCNDLSLPVCFPTPWGFNPICVRVCLCMYTCAFPYVASLSIKEYLKWHWHTLLHPLQFVGLRASPATGFEEVTCYLIITYLNSIAIQLTGYLPNLLWQCGI